MRLRLTGQVLKDLKAQAQAAVDGQQETTPVDPEMLLKICTELENLWGSCGGLRLK